MFTTYARQYLALLASLACIACTAPALGFAFDLKNAGWHYWGFLLPGLSFLLGGLFAMKAEALEPDPLPPALLRMPMHGRGYTVKA